MKKMYIKEQKYFQKLNKKIVIQINTNDILFYCKNTY